MKRHPMIKNIHFEPTPTPIRLVLTPAQTKELLRWLPTSENRCYSYANWEEVKKLKAKLLTALGEP